MAKRPETFESIVQKMVDAGYDCSCGRHYGVRGYYASFQHEDQALIESPSIALWKDSGHGDTLLDAVKTGRALALGVEVVIPEPESFE